MTSLVSILARAPLSSTLLSRARPLSLLLRTRPPNPLRPRPAAPHAPLSPPPPKPRHRKIKTLSL